MGRLHRLARALPASFALALALHAAVTRAQDATPPRLVSSGFGTLGVVHSSEDQADFITSIFKPDGAGYTRSWALGVDSVLGAQVDLRVAPRISAVLQVVSEQSHDKRYTPRVEWANVKYEVTPDFFVRAGRVVMPSFMGSGYRKVGFASPWVRPPVEIYGIVPISKNDGVDASYRLRFGDAVNTTQATYGSLKSTAVDGSHSWGRQQWGIFDTIEYGALTVRAAYHQTHLTLETLQPFFAAFRAFGPAGAAIADRYVCDGKLTHFATLGASYDPGTWFLQGEWAAANSHCFVGARNGWYVGGGYRFGKLAPYASFARTWPRGGTSSPGLDVSTLPPPQRGPAAGLNAALNGIIGSVPSQETIAIGTRWDFTKDAALKLQLDHIRLGAGTHGTLANVQPGFQPRGRLDVVSISLDFVFR